jgi:hypothetical protein
VYGEPYQGGYADFAPLELDFTTWDKSGTSSNSSQVGLSQRQCGMGPKRVSIFDDLKYYWEHHASRVGHITTHPICATYFLQKVIVSNYAILAEYFRSALCESEFANQMAETNPRAAQVEQRWNDMQSWATRCREYNDFIDDILEGRDGVEERLIAYDGSVKANLSQVVSQQAKMWHECTTDFRSIQTRLRKISGRCDQLVTSYNALAGMVGNRQAVTEAKRVTVLTILAMLFLPLSFVATLFGTNDPWTIGGDAQGTLYATMVGTTAGVMLLALAAHVGFTDDGQWRLARVLLKTNEVLLAWPSALLNAIAQLGKAVFEKQRHSGIV